MNGAAARELFEYSGYAPDNGGGIAGVRDMFRLPLGAQNEEENALVEEGALQPNADTFYGRYKNLFEWDRLKEGIPVASPSKTRTDNWAQYESFAAQAADQDRRHLQSEVAKLEKQLSAANIRLRNAQDSYQISEALPLIEKLRAQIDIASQNIKTAASECRVDMQVSFSLILLPVFV